MCMVYMTEPGTQVIKRGGKFILQKEQQEVAAIPKETLDGLVLTSSVQLSSPVIMDLMRRHIPVSWMTVDGKYCGHLTSADGHQAEKQKKQVLLEESAVALSLAKNIVDAKIKNQLVLLRRFNRTAKLKNVEKTIYLLLALRKKVADVKLKSKLMGLEGIAAKAYFEALGQMVPEPFAFSGRNRRPAKDPFNAMLSFGYTLLGNEIYTAVMANGLHPYFGCLHTVRNGHPALVSDLLEEWRPVIVDAMVWNLVSHNRIHPEQFTKTKTGGLHMDKEGRKVFLASYEKKMRTLLKQGKDEISYRQLIARQPYHYSRAILHEDAALYTPFLMR